MTEVAYNGQQYQVLLNATEPHEVYVIKQRRQGRNGLYAVPTTYRQRITSPRKRKILISLAEKTNA